MKHRNEVVNGQNDLVGIQNEDLKEYIRKLIETNDLLISRLENENRVFNEYRANKSNYGNN